MCHNNKKTIAKVFVLFAIFIFKSVFWAIFDTQLVYFIRKLVILVILHQEKVSSKTQTGILLRKTLHILIEFVHHVPQ